MEEYEVTSDEADGGVDESEDDTVEQGNRPFGSHPNGSESH